MTSGFERKIVGPWSSAPRNPPGQTTLVGGWATPLKNMISSIGMMKFPIFLGA